MFPSEGQARVMERPAGNVALSQPKRADDAEAGRIDVRARRTDRGDIRKAFDQDNDKADRREEHPDLGVEDGPDKGDAGGKKESDKGQEQRPNKGDGGDHSDKAGSNKDDGGGKTRRWPIFLLIGLTVVAAIGGAGYWFSIRNEESTDDAYTEGNAISTAPKVSGYVVERLVDDNTFVHAGDLMLRIDPRDFITARDQARANLELAEAQLHSEEINLDISRVRYPADRAKAQAQLAQAHANQFSAGRGYQRQRTVDQRATTQTTVDVATAQFQTTTATTRQLEKQLKVSSLVF